MNNPTETMGDIIAKLERDLKSAMEEIERKSFALHGLERDNAALRAEIETVKDAMRADDERLRIAGERVGVIAGCDTPEWMADEILALRAKIADYENGWKACMEENAEEQHCTCVPSLKIRVRELEAENAALKQRDNLEWQFGYEDGIAGVCKDGTTVESEDYKRGNNTGFHDRIRLINFHTRPLREMLKRLAVDIIWTDDDTCRICGGKSHQHIPTCALAALLKGENNDAL